MSVYTPADFLVEWLVTDRPQSAGGRTWTNKWDYCISECNHCGGRSSRAYPQGDPGLRVMSKFEAELLSRECVLHTTECALLLASSIAAAQSMRGKL